MTDYTWNDEKRNIIAKLVLSKDIAPGQKANLGTHDICAIFEGGGYTDNHTGENPILIPKVSILGKLMRKKPDKRDHLFVHKGPHEVELKIDASWRSGQRSQVVGNMQVTISSGEVGPLFELAQRSDVNEITPADLANAVKANVAGNFAEDVMSLNDKPTTEEEHRSHQNKFAQLADDELGEFGVNVKKVVLRYEDDPHTTASLKADEDDATRRKRRASGKQDFAEGLQDLTDGIGQDAIEKAKESDLAEKAAERIAKHGVRTSEDIGHELIDEQYEEHLSDQELAKIKREGRAMKARTDVARGLSPKSEEDE